MSKAKSPRVPIPPKRLPEHKPVVVPLAPNGRPITATGVARCGHIVYYTTADEVALICKLVRIKGKLCPDCWRKENPADVLAAQKMECRKPDSERGAA